eukprot:Gb_28218 [translate_table: standard]
MLLRSSSTPVLNSLISPRAKSDLNSPVRRFKSVQLSPSSTGFSSSGFHALHDGNGSLNNWAIEQWSRRRRNHGISGLAVNEGLMKHERKVSGEIALEDNYLDSPRTKLQSSENPHKDSRSFVEGKLVATRASVSGRKTKNLISVDEEICHPVGFESSGVALVCNKPVHASENEVGSVYTSGGFGIGDGGGLSGGRGSGGRGGISVSDSNSTNAYYQKMLEVNPGNPLLLRNYAKFLHELEEIAKLLRVSNKKRDCKVKLQGSEQGRKGHLSIAARIFEVTPLLFVVEVSKAGGDTLGWEEVTPKEMIATQQEMVEARVPLLYREQCAHLLIPLNKCRMKEYYLPWKCVDEKHTYKKCEY